MATALPGTGVPVSTDILTTLNGGAATAGEAIQRIKLSTGVPGTATDVSASNPVPVTGPLTDAQIRATPVTVTMINTLALTDTQLRASAVATNLIQPDVNITGTITTTDIVVSAPGGAGALLTGASTAGSFVFSAITGGYTAWVAQITGLTSGSVYFEGSTDSTTGADGNWVNLIGRQIGILNSVLTGVATGNGNWRGNLSSYRFFRLRAVGALTGTPAILIRMSAGVATVFLNGSLPTGTNTIGAVNIAAAQTLATVTTVSAVTAITNALPTGANTIGTVNQGTANAAAWLANPLTSQITAEASTAKTVTGNSASTIINASSTGVMLFLNASVASGTTPSLTVRVQVLDPVSGGWVDLPGAAFAAVVAATASPLLLVIDLGVVAVANSAVNMPLPRSWRLAWVISGTTPSFTFSVGAQYLI